MNTWRTSRQARAFASRFRGDGWLAGGVVLSLFAAHHMREVVPPWAVALCVIAAPCAGIAGRRARTAGEAATILLAGAAGAVTIGVLTESSWGTALTVLALACAAPWFGGRYLHNQDELADAAAHRARLEERTRIAQDMHDSLGHELNLLALRAGAMELDPTLTPTHHAAASELRAGASSAISQLAAVIGVLRGDGPAPCGPPNPDVTELVERAADAGMDVTLERLDPKSLPPFVARCVYRVVQEGITNAARHAPGAAVIVTIDSNADETQVTVTNTPPDRTLRRSPGSHTGLVALEERLAACGGTVTAGPHLGGFRLRGRVPDGGRQ